jgi:homoserine O-succinyltransferase/O-acetyltransferase
MPLIIEGPIPSRWAENCAEKLGSDASVSSGSGFQPEECVTLALVNNMPDPALEDTELQFFELLDTASGDIPVIVKLYSLAGVPRTDRGRRHLDSFYYNFDDIGHSRLDGIIITGTEPHQPDLRDEPYWSALTQLFDWAEQNTVSAVLSCLAAHASVLHGDGIPRHRLPDKQFGVFESARGCGHTLTSGGGDRFRFPHSRWNEVREDELVASGYSILTSSKEAGVDLFVKKRRKSLFVHFQGHPEYGALTLLKEYRRDIRRFLARERETYPTAPAGYFDTFATQLLDSFREHAISHRHEDIIEHFPEAAAVKGLDNSWNASATCIYSNWLHYVISRKAETVAFAPVAAFSGQSQRNSSRVS